MDVLRPDTAALLERVTVRELLDIPPGVIDRARQLAHQLYRAGRLVEADVVCRGLIACDHRCAWTYSLHAAVLRRQGRLERAVAQVQRGLAHEPGHAKLSAMRDELVAALPVRPPTRPAPSPVIGQAAPGQRVPAQRADDSTDSDP